MTERGKTFTGMEYKELLAECLEALAECLEAFEALESSTPSENAKILLKKRGTPPARYNGTAASQLARKMAQLIRAHIAESS